MPRALWPSQGLYVGTIRCCHIGEEWVEEAVELIDPETLLCDGEEHLVRYCKTVRPDARGESYFRLTGSWEDAEEALVSGNLFDYGYAQYDERMRVLAACREGQGDKAQS